MATLAKTDPTVNYRQASWWQNYVMARSCGSCSMFRGPDPDRGTCTLVLGRIKVDDVCDRWERAR